VILTLFCSPSLRQLDGLGGADITTSKVAIIGPPPIRMLMLIIHLYRSIWMKPLLISAEIAATSPLAWDPLLSINNVLVA